MLLTEQVLHLTLEHIFQKQITDNKWILQKWSLKEETGWWDVPAFAFLESFMSSHGDSQVSPGSNRLAIFFRRQQQKDMSQRTGHCLVNSSRPASLASCCLLQKSPLALLDSSLYWSVSLSPTTRVCFEEIMQTSRGMFGVWRTALLSEALIVSGWSDSSEIVSLRAGQTFVNKS